MSVLRPIAGAAVLAAFSVPAFAEEIEAVDLYDLPAADVVVLGEVHDNPVHHAHQSIAVAAIGAKALVFEMLRPEQAELIEGDLLRSEAALGTVLRWESSGWPEFGMYYPIFVAAPDVAFYGGGGARSEAREALTVGAAAVFGEDAAQFGLTLALPQDELITREEGHITAHCNAIPTDLARSMIESQRLRDAWLAQAALQALEETGGPVAVITGNGHARSDWGVPALLSRAAPEVSVLTIGQYEEPAADDPPFDLWMVTDATPRPDPCEVFRR